MAGTIDTGIVTARISPTHARPSTSWPVRGRRVRYPRSAAKRSEERVAELLDAAESEWLFVSGCATNQAKFHDRFDEVVLLSAPTELILQRLASRTSNDYGKRPEEVAEVLGYIETVEPRLRRVADHEIDTSAPLEHVVDLLLELVG